MYDDGVELKLNDVVEVVGVLSRLPELAAAHLATGEEVRSVYQSALVLDHVLHCYWLCTARVLGLKRL